MPRISDFPIKSNPSTAANLSAVDGGENVQIPTSVFAKKTDIPSVSGLASTSYVDTKLQTFCGDLINGMDAEGNTLKVGCAEEADRINRKNVGSATQPVYFLEGVPVATTLATVATSGSYNDLTDKPTIPSGGGSGGGASIIDIEVFPSSPSTSVIYRKWQVVKAVWVYAYTSSGSLETTIPTDGTMVCETVNTLPEVGEPCYLGSSMYAYYQRTDGEVYGYVDSNLSSAMGVPAGWYPAATLFSALGGDTYLGTIDSLEDATEQGYYALLTKKPHLYHFYNDSEGNIVKSAIITNDNYDFDENLGTLTQVIVL